MKVFIFDNETDGLIANEAIRKEKWPRITEIYGALIDFSEHLDEPQVIGEIDTLIQTGREIPEDVVKITGITTAMLVGQPKLPEAARHLRELIFLSDRVVAHNLSFDKTVIDLEFNRLGLEPIVWSELYCTVENTEHLFGRRLKLNDLHKELLGEEFSGAHRAKVDVQALIRCYRELLKRGIA